MQRIKRMKVIERGKTMVASESATALSRRDLICSLTVLTMGAERAVRSGAANSVTPTAQGIVIVQGWILSSADLA